MTLRDDLDMTRRPEDIERILRGRADNFRFSPDLEVAADLMEKGERLSPERTMALGYYEDAKRAADASGRDVSDPVPEQTGNRLANAYNNLRESN
ncbi:hypothetical protein [Streptomyces sp. NPDC002692]